MWKSACSARARIYATHDLSRLGTGRRLRDLRPKHGRFGRAVRGVGAAVPWVALMTAVVEVGRPLRECHRRRPLGRTVRCWRVRPRGRGKLAHPASVFAEPPSLVRRLLLGAA